MPNALVKFVTYSRRSDILLPPPNEQEKDDLDRILSLLRAGTAHDFRCYRKSMVRRRVQRRMGVCHVDQLGDYLERLRSDPEEPGRLFRDLLIGVTGFFREPESYRILEQRVIGPLAERKYPDSPVRVWVPGCSTGEEAYSIAMLIIEAVAGRRSTSDVNIFATDIDEEALEFGRRGVYPESIAADISPERLHRFFSATDDQHYRVCKSLRESVVFAPQNLITDAPFSKLDLISCRNLLIYLEPGLQRKIISLFHFSLNEGGHLCLGPSESVGQLTDLFDTVSKKWRVFRRIGPTRRDLVQFPITPPDGRHGQAGPGPDPTSTGRRGFAALTQRLLLDEYAPAAVLVNRRYEILYFFGATMKFLDLPSGEPTRDLSAMAREGLRTKLRAACHKALRDAAPVTVGNAHVKREGGFVPVEVRIKPLLESPSTEGLLLVTFLERAEHTRSQTGKPLSDEGFDHASLVQQLDLELKATREDLQSTIEEMEGTNEDLKASNEEIMSMNEELQSANEELQSANEELETSKEELQSLNEELSTVNNQLSDKVEELERSNNDIVNLLSNTDVSTVFLDASLNIKLFTPPATRLFNLRDTDIGRPLSDFSPNFSDEGLLADAEAVLEKLVPIEREVPTADDHHFLLRIRPYRTQDKRIDGVVITFVDITNRIRNERQLRENEARLRELNSSLEQRIAERTAVLSQREAELRTLAANVPALFSYLDADQVYRYVNRRYEECYERRSDQFLGKSALDLLGPEGYAAARPHIDKVLAGEADHYEADFELPDGRHTMDVVYVPDLDADGQVKGFFVLAQDITERKALQQQLYASEERLSAIVHAAGDGIVTIDHEGTVRDFNPAAVRIFGLETETAIGQDAGPLLPLECRGCTEYPACFHTARCPAVNGRARELTGCRQDGTLFPMEATVREVGRLGLYVVVVRDVSDRKALEREIIDASTLEQERIGRDMHDGIGQQLTAMSMLAGSIARRLTTAGQREEGKQVKGLMDHLQETLVQTRALARGLSPVASDQEGLADALSAFAERVTATSKVDCRFEGPASVPVADGKRQHLYRIAQEAVHNALRHGQPRHIQIRLESDGQAAVLSVRDDGTAIPPAQDRQRGLGLQIMSDRARIIGGRLTVEPAADAGTLVRCVIPIAE